MPSDNTTNIMILKKITRKEKKGINKCSQILITGNSEVHDIVTCLKFFIIKFKEKIISAAHLLSF